MDGDLYEGWAIVILVDRAPLAGLLRYEQIGTVHQWMLEVPAGHHHDAYRMLLDPLLIKRVIPCSDTDAVKFMRAATPVRDPPAA